MEQGHVQTTINNKIATITFSHPASNSLTSKLLGDLTREINNLNSNAQVILIVIKSLGEKAFCAGASFDELLLVNDAEKGKQFFSGFANVINAIRKSNKIVVAQVHGKAVGGGVGLVAACDYALASEDASIKLSELAIGIGPFVIEPAVSRKMGKIAFAQMTLSPDQWHISQWAKNNNLYANVLESVEILEIETQKFTEKLCNYSPIALQEIKKILWEGTENWDELLMERAKISGKLVLSSFTKNALENFKK
jgi:methylglutaconyl-CoA hydratase